MSTALRIVHGNFGRVALLDMDCSLVRHAHPHCHVLFKVAGADTQFVVRNRIHALTDSAAVLVDGWQPHSYVHDPARPRTLILALYVEPEWLKAFRPGWAASGAPGFFETPHGEVSPGIRKLTMDLASEMMADPECQAEYEALLSELMIAVIERFTPWKSFPRSIRELNASACDRRIRRAAEYIRSNAGGEASIDTLAKEAGLSRAHFFRLFQSSIGLPPKVYLNVVRMERAVEAFLHRDVPVGEVGARLGFSDPAHFTRFFRNNAGVSPSEFRQVSRLAG
jgi:AraC-like DNA-binding protein